MGRALRTDAVGVWHHVMNRGAGRRVVFIDDEDRFAFLDLLTQLDQRFGVEVHAFCLMGTHFHLLVRCREPRLSDAMQWLGSLFTKHANTRRGVDGAIFRGRFHSVMVERPEHLDWLFRYVNANPIDIGWAGPLVDCPWSGLARSVGREPADWLLTDYVTSRWGQDGHGLLAFVESARAPSTPAAFVAGQVDPEGVLSAARLAAVTGGLVHGRGDVRSVAAVIGVDVFGCDVDQILRGDVDPSSRDKQLQRARRRVETRPELTAFCERVLDVLSTPESSMSVTTCSD